MDLRHYQEVKAMYQNNYNAINNDFSKQNMNKSLFSY